MSSSDKPGSSQQQTRPNVLQRLRNRLPSLPACSCCSCSRSRFVPGSSRSREQDADTSVARSKRSAPWWSCSSSKNRERQQLLKSAMARTTEDVKHLRFWRSVASEFIGTVFLVMIGCGSWVQTTRIPLPDDAQGTIEHPDTVRISLAFGLTYAVIIYCFRNVTDAHLNPAITAAMLITRRTCLIRGILYIVAQFLGAILGAALIFGLTHDDYRHIIGCTVPAAEVSDAQAFGIEFFSTFILVFVVFAAYEKTRREEAICAPFIIGLALAAVSLFAHPYTGASVNTARTFGPAVVKGVWKDHWIYWFGPLLGGILGGAVYDIVYSTNASLNRMKKCMLVFHGAKKDGGDGEQFSEAEMGQLGSKECPDAESDIALHPTKLRDQDEVNKGSESGDGDSVGEEAKLKP